MPETVLHIRVLVVPEEGLRWNPPHYGGNCENGIGMAFTFMAPVPNLQNPLRVVREKQQVQCLVLRNLAILGTQNSPFGRAEYGWCYVLLDGLVRCQGRKSGPSCCVILMQNLEAGKLSNQSVKNWVKLIKDVS